MNTVISRKKHTWHDKGCNHSELWSFILFFMILFWIHVHVFEKKPNYLSITFVHKSCWLFLYVLWIEFLYHLPRLLFDIYLTSNGRKHFFVLCNLTSLWVTFRRMCRLLEHFHNWTIIGIRKPFEQKVNVLG